MSEKIFQGFIKEKEASPEVCKQYEGILPSEMTALWEKYGFGSIMGGYLKVINPEEYQQLLLDTYFRGSISIPMLATAFGDIITWEENRYIRIIKYKNGIFQGMAAGFDFFLEDLQSGYYSKNYFEISKYEEAVKMWGCIAFDECFGYVPLLGLGGSGSVKSLKKVKIREHIEIIAQLAGKIGM